MKFVGLFLNKLFKDLNPKLNSKPFNQNVICLKAEVLFK